MPSEKNSKALVQKYYAVTEVRVICMVREEAHRRILLRTE